MKLSFTSLLAILFIGLKLGGVIGWSWVWVLSPLWIPAVAFVSLATFVALHKPSRERFFQIIEKNARDRAARKWIDKHST